MAKYHSATVWGGTAVHSTASERKHCSPFLGVPEVMFSPLLPEVLRSDSEGVR